MFLIIFATAATVIFLRFVIQKNFSVGDAVKYVTINPAKVLQIEKRKGCIKEGYDADILLLDNNYDIDTVFMKGKTMMRNKEVLIKGAFEE